MLLYKFLLFHIFLSVLFIGPSNTTPTKNGPSYSIMITKSITIRISILRAIFSFPHEIEKLAVRCASGEASLVPHTEMQEAGSVIKYTHHKMRSWLPPPSSTPNFPWSLNEAHASLLRSERSPSSVRLRYVIPRLLRLRWSLWRGTSSGPESNKHSEFRVTRTRMRYVGSKWSWRRKKRGLLEKTYKIGCVIKDMQEMMFKKGRKRGRKKRRKKGRLRMYKKWRIRI